MTPANTLARTSSRNCSIGATSFRRLAHGGFLSVPHFCVKVKVKCPDSRQKGTVSPVPITHSIASPSRVNPRSLSVLYRPVRLSASSVHEMEPFRNSAALVGPNIASCLAGGNVFHHPPKNSRVVPAFRIFLPPVPILPGSRSTHGRMTRCTSSSGTPQSRGLLVIHCLTHRQRQCLGMGGDASPIL